MTEEQLLQKIKELEELNVDLIKEVQEKEAIIQLADELIVALVAIAPKENGENKVRFFAAAGLMLKFIEKLPNSKTATTYTNKK